MHADVPVFEFQSTFPRRERRFRRKASGLLNLVSIHVPAKGTTTAVVLSCHSPGVSIHVPAKGHDPEAGSVNDQGFNPRSREGNDRDKQDIGIYEIVSIHVPAKGTT